MLLEGNHLDSISAVTIILKCQLTFHVKLFFKLGIFFGGPTFLQKVFKIFLSFLLTIEKEFHPYTPHMPSTMG